MPLIPYNSDYEEEENGIEDDVTLTGIEVSDANRQQILQALHLNEEMLNESHPNAEVDEAAVRATIDDLLDQLNETNGS